MSVVQKFNGLNGAVVTRKAAEKLMHQAKEQEQPELAERLAKVLKNNPKEKSFTFKIEDPAIEQLPQSMLAGFQLDELNEETGLNGVSQQEIYDKVTKMILNTIKKVGHLPWQKDWQGSGGGNNAMNYVSGKAYTGINFLMLNFDQLIDEDGEPYLVPVNFIQPYYLTFKQIESAGAKLKKGSKARNVFYYTPIFVYNHDGVNIRTSDKAKFNEQVKEHGVSADDIKRYAGKIPVVKYYNVYRADDCTGLTFPERPKKVIEPIEAAQGIIDHYPNPPRFTFGGDDAVFYPLSDTVNMPVIKDFDTPQGYYCTYFHEIIHSTGHKKRLDRGLGKKPTPKEYAFEELIAELGAVYLCGQSGILFSTKDNSAKYLSYYLKQLTKQLKEDNRFFFRAAAAAQKAADHILDLDADDVPAYLQKAVKEVKPAKKRKTIAKTVATKPEGKTITKTLNSFFDNVDEFVYPEGVKNAGRSEYTAKRGDYVLSIKPSSKGHDVFLGKPGKDVGKVSTFGQIESWFPTSETELLEVIEKAKKTIKGSGLPAPKVIRKIKNKNPQQLTLGLQGKTKTVKKQGLNAIYTEKQFEETVNVLKENPVPAEPIEVPEPVAASSRPGSLAERRQQRQNKVIEYYHVPNPEIDRFLGNVEMKKKESVAITLTGGQGSGKTRMVFQLMNTFAQNYKVGHASIEEHPESTLYFDKVEQYLDETALNNISAPEIKGIEDLHKLIIENDVVVIDSFQKLQEMIPRFELDKDLRKKYDGKLFIIIFQQTTDGSMRGGSKSQFDGDIILFTQKFPDYRENYIYPDKNRYNSIPADQLKFNIYSGKMVRPEPEQPTAEPVPAAPGLNAPAVPLQFTAN